jgi:hypothetical protein
MGVDENASWTDSYNGGNKQFTGRLDKVTVEPKRCSTARGDVTGSR